MKKILLAILAILVVLGGSSLFAQASKTVSMTVTLSAWSDLSIGVAALTFTDVPPDFVASPPNKSIAANENPVSVRAYANGKETDTLNLNVVANSDLTAGTETIGIGAISWTATGAGYEPGAMVKTTAVLAGTWTGTVYHWHDGTFSFSFLRDYINQASGVYTSSATYTLSGV